MHVSLDFLFALASCHECLRHFYNQYIEERLDRKLATELLSFALDGAVAEPSDLDSQADNLTGLARLLELGGYTCTRRKQINGIRVPLYVEAGERQVAVGVHSGLLSRDEIEHPLEALDGVEGIHVRILNQYIIKRNLPDAYQVIQRMLGP